MSTELGWRKPCPVSKRADEIRGLRVAEFGGDIGNLDVSLSQQADREPQTFGFDKLRVSDAAFAQAALQRAHADAGQGGGMADIRIGAPEAGPDHITQGADEIARRAWWSRPLNGMAASKPGSSDGGCKAGRRNADRPRLALEADIGFEKGLILAFPAREGASRLR